MTLTLRPAEAGDATTIAELHAESWRRHYRGALADGYLDGDVVADRMAVWSARLAEPDPRAHTVVAEDAGTVLGFAHTDFEADPTWGALLDNLHVRHAAARRGIGRRLLAAAAAATLDRGTGLYLWVLEQNVAAQAFYDARGGRRVDRAPALAPGGVASRLAGSPPALRYVWAVDALPLAGESARS